MEDETERWRMCCILGPKAPKRLGESPRDARRASSRPISLSSLSLSVGAPMSPPILLARPPPLAPLLLPPPMAIKELQLNEEH